MNDKEPMLDRRRFVAVALASSAGAYVGTLVALGSEDHPEPPADLDDLDRFEWGFVVDTTACIGCGACVRACKIENDVPDGYFRTWVERYEIGAGENVHVDSPNGALDGFARDATTDAAAKAFFVPKLCNHCEASACTQVCPVGATFRSPDGVVLVDPEHCIGCGYCVQACPYGCRFVNPETGTTDKCTLCYHRLQRGLDPACVAACPRGARLCGNLKDPESEIRRILRERRYNLLKPELSTNPRCFYIGLDMEVK